MAVLRGGRAQWEQARHARAPSGASETGNGVQEPPPTPSSSSHTPNHALTLGSSGAAVAAVADRTAYPTLQGAGEKLRAGSGRAGLPSRQSVESEEEVFQDAAEALPNEEGVGFTGQSGRVI
jgi:hypothetical protein